MSETRVGESLTDKLFGKYKEVRAINKDIDYLDKQYEDFFEDKKYAFFNDVNNSKYFDIFSKYNMITMYSFADQRYLRDKGEEALIKELSDRRNKRYEILLGFVDVSKCSVSKSYIREERFKKLLDKDKD
jgi:hypothetical protein